MIPPESPISQWRKQVTPPVPSALSRLPRICRTSYRRFGGTTFDKRPFGCNIPACEVLQQQYAATVKSLTGTGKTTGFRFQDQCGGLEAVNYATTLAAGHTYMEKRVHLLDCMIHGIQHHAALGKGFVRRSRRLAGKIAQ